MESEFVYEAPDDLHDLAYESIYSYLPGGKYHSPLNALKEDYLFDGFCYLVMVDVFDFDRDANACLYFNYMARDNVDTSAAFDGKKQTFSFHVYKNIEADVKLMMDFTGIERSGQAHVEEAMVFENVPYNQAFRELQTVNWFGFAEVAITTIQETQPEMLALSELFTKDFQNVDSVLTAVLP